MMVFSFRKNKIKGKELGLQDRFKEALKSGAKIKVIDPHAVPLRLINVDGQGIWDNRSKSNLTE